jgi:hypothetical protein
VSRLNKLLHRLDFMIQNGCVGHLSAISVNRRRLCAAFMRGPAPSYECEEMVIRVDDETTAIHHGGK